MERGLAFVLGSTETGKTTLVNTLQEFVTNPTDSPKAWLTEEHTDKLETQVLEVYDGFSLKSKKNLSIALEGDKPALVKFREQVDVAMASDKAKQCVIRMLDIGGHQEYYYCTSLFLANSGTFLVCVDVQKVQEKQVESQYYGSIGGYLDQGTQGVGIKPKIVLVATKVEETADAKRLANRLLGLAKTNLKSLKADVFVVNEVWMTSSKNADRATLEDIFAKLSTLSSEGALSSLGPITTPFTWWTLLTLLRSLYVHNGFVTLEEVAKKYREIQKENGGATNLTEEEISSLSKLKEVALLWTQDASPKKLVPKEPLNGPLASTSKVKVPTKAEPKQKVENTTVSSAVEDESTKEVGIILDYFLSRLTYKDFLHLYDLGPKQVFTAEKTW